LNKNYHLALPFFYINDYGPSQSTMLLNEETSKHIVQVLRMKTGENVNLTDGKGNLLTAIIEDDHKKHCSVPAFGPRSFCPKVVVSLVLTG